MFCSNCGTELIEGAKFCPNCGTPVQGQSNETDIFSNPEETVELFAEADVPVVNNAIDAVFVDDFKQEAESVNGEDGNSEQQDNSELLTAIENTIPVLVSYGDTIIKEPDSVVETPQETTTEDFVIDGNDVEAEGTAELPPVQIPAAYRASTDQPAYVQEFANVAPPEYAQQTNATPLSVQVGQNPPPVKKEKGKKSKLPIIIAIALIALAVIGYFVYQNLPSVKFEKAMTAGETAYENGDYVTALEKFHEAYDINPEDEVTQDNLFNCYNIMAYDAYDIDDYSRCIDYYEEAKVYCPRYVDDCNMYIAAVYSDWCLNTASDGDIEKAEEIYAKGLGAGYDMADTRADLDVIIATAQMMKAGGEAAQNLAESITNNTSLSLIMLTFTDLPKTFIDDYISAGGEFPVIFDVTGTKYNRLGFYDLGDSMYAFYFGEYSGDVRQGHGEWYVYVPQGFGSLTEYSMDGEWVDDIPNGEAVEHYINIRSMGDTSERYIYSNVKNGLYDGDVTWDYPDSDQYVGSFTNGIVDVIDTVDPNGNDSYVIAYNSNKSGWIYYNESQLDDLKGVLGFN